MLTAEDDREVARVGVADHGRLGCGVGELVLRQIVGHVQAQSPRCAYYWFPVDSEHSCGAPAVSDCGGEPAYVLFCPDGSRPMNFARLTSRLPLPHTSAPS